MTDMNSFAETVSGLLDEYGDAVSAAMAEVLPNVAKEAKTKIRGGSPSRTGKYKKSWRSKVETNRLEVGAVVYAEAPGYRLAHLLEYGHAKRGGGRTKAIEHIKPVEEWAVTEAEKRIVEKLGKGT